MDEGARPKPRYLVEVRKKHHTLFYWQPSAELRALGHIPRRLADKTNDRDQAYDEAEIINAELDQARDQRPTAGAAQPRTMKGLIATFEKDRRYTTAITKKTRRGYDQNMKIIARHFGDIPVAKLSRAMLEKFYNKLYPRAPWQANAVMRMFNRLLHCASTYGWVKVNVAAKMELAGCAPRSQLWEEEDLDYFCRIAVWLGRPSMALAVRLAVEAGQREADNLTLPWSKYIDGRLRLRQNKTGKWIEVRCTDELRALLDAADPRQVADRRWREAGNGGPPLDDEQLASSCIITSETTGRPYGEDNFRHVFAEIRGIAELDPELRYQDLRRTCVVNLGRAGATPPEIAAITLHEIDRVLKILETYLPRDSIMAEHAITKLEAWKRQQAERRNRAKGGAV